MLSLDFAAVLDSWSEPMRMGGASWARGCPGSRIQEQRLGGSAPVPGISFRGGALSPEQRLAGSPARLAIGEEPASQRFSDQLIAVLPRLRRFARGLAGSAVEADDLVQAACERALARRHQFEEGTRFDSWMFRIVQTIWIDQIRSRRVRKEDGDIGEERLGSDEPVRRVEARLALDEVRRAVDRLPPDQRAVAGVGDSRRAQLQGGGRGGAGAGRDDHEPPRPGAGRAAAPARGGRRQCAGVRRMQRRSDDRLVAYLDGELEAAERREVEAWLDSDPAARDELAALAHSAGLVRRAYDEMLHEPLPERLIAAARGETARPAAEVAAQSPRDRFATAVRAAAVVRRRRRTRGSAAAVAPRSAGCGLAVSAC